MRKEHIYIKLLFPLSVFTFTFLLQGCVSTAVMGIVSAVGTKVAIDPRTLGTQIDDSILEIRVNRALSKDEEVNQKARINVIAYHGKVLLIGQAMNIKLASRAKHIATSVVGVTEVYNQIHQGHPISLITTSLDTWITAKVYLQLLGSSQVKLSNVKVTTENGEVFLLGLVKEREGKAAANIASRVSGVKHVTTAFIYIN